MYDDIIMLYDTVLLDLLFVVVNERKHKTQHNSSRVDGTVFSIKIGIFEFMSVKINWQNNRQKCWEMNDIKKLKFIGSRASREWTICIYSRQNILLRSCLEKIKEG